MTSYETILGGHLTEQQIPNERILKEINELQDFFNDKLTKEEKDFLVTMFKNKYFNEITELSSKETEFMEEHVILKAKYTATILLIAVLTSNVEEEFFNFKDSSNIGKKISEFRDEALFELGKCASIIQLGKAEEIINLVQFKNTYTRNRAKGGRKKGENYRETVTRIENKVAELYKNDPTITWMKVLTFFQDNNLFQKQTIAESSLIKRVQTQLKKLKENTSKPANILE